MTTAQTLLKMQEDIETAKTAKAQGEGTLTHVEKQLKQAGASSVADAEKKTKAMTKKIDERNKSLDKGIEEVQKQYGIGA